MCRIRVCTDFLSLVGRYVMPFIFGLHKLQFFRRLVGPSFVSAAQNVIGFDRGSPYIRMPPSGGKPCITDDCSIGHSKQPEVLREGMHDPS